MIDHPVRTLHELVEAQAARSPTAIAIEHGQQRLTYQQLNARANQLAHYLRAEGVGPDCLVGLCVERSIDAMVGVLGVLKAGGAYVPLDPNYPVDRLRVIREDADIELLLTNEKNRSLVPHHGRKVLLDEGWPAVARYSAENPAPLATAGHLAYVVYTSGSTGRPKGVLLEHRGIYYLARAQERTFGLGVGSRVLQFFSLNFDGLIWELSMTWSVGATLVVADPTTLLPGPSLIRFLQENAIHMVSMTPSALLASPYADLPELHTIVTGGEALSAELVARWAPGRRFFNVYAPTETTVVAIVAQCRAGEGKPPLGRPFEHVAVHVLDDDMRPVPDGEPGELYIGGPGVARGYLKRPDLTAERFIESPFPETAGTRLYKTGDRVRWLPDGNLDFLGRNDHQVKLRGFRIELEEIATVLREHPAVREAAVVVLEDVPGDKRLVAYVIAHGEAAQAAAEARLRTPALRAFLQERLPEYMVPAAFVELDVLPLTPNGKLDRSALPAPENARPELAQAFEAPRSALDESLAAIWAEILRVDRVGIHDDFFELGGDSLLAGHLVAEIRARLGANIKISQLYEQPTIDGLLQLWPGTAPTGPAGTSTAAPALGTAAEVVRVEDLGLDRFLTASRPATGLSPEARVALLTGANGFLGRFLLLELLQRLPVAGGKLYCVVRAASDEQARERVEATYRGHDPALEERFRWLSREGRLVVLAGDLAQPRFGLAAEVHARLAEEVDCVVHNGAVVNHVLSYAQVFEPNVLGTVEAIRFAIERRLKSVSYVSSVGAISGIDRTGVVLEDEDVRTLVPERPLNAGYAPGYATSKWASEVLLRDAHDRLGIPVYVFRPGGIMAHSRYRGQINARDFFTRLLCGIVYTGLAPSSFYAGGRSGRTGHYDGLPVDVVARSIAAISIHREATQGDGQSYATYHLLNPYWDDGISLDVIVDWVQSAGYPVERIEDYATWFGAFRDRLTSLGEPWRQHSPLPILHGWERQQLRGLVLDVDLDARRLLERLRHVTGPHDGEELAALPHVSEPFIHKYLDDMMALGLIEPPAPRRTQG